MSKHIIKPDRYIEIHMGYDRPLACCYCTVLKKTGKEEEAIYDCSHDEEMPIIGRNINFPIIDQLEYFKKKILELNEHWLLPQTFWMGVIEDAMTHKFATNQASNKIVDHGVLCK